MNLKQAQYLEAVCKTGSVTAAAAELYVSRTVISHSLSELENEFNATLFTRSRTGIELTETGEILREYCRQHKIAYSVAQEKIRALTFPESHPRVKFAFTTTTGIRLFPEFFQGMMAECPGITYTVEEMSAYSTIESVREGAVDFAVTPVNLRDNDCDDIDSSFLHKLRSVICVSKSDPLSQERFLTQQMIDEKPFITPTTKNPLPFPVNIIMHLNQIDLIHRVVTSSIAATIMPTDYIKDWDDVAQISLEEEVISDVNIIWSRSAPHSRTFYKVLDFVKRYDISKLEQYETT